MFRPLVCSLVSFFLGVLSSFTTTTAATPPTSIKMRSALITTGLLVAAATAQNSSCVSGDAVHMIVARASLEPPGTGAIGNVSTRVADQLPGSNIVAVDYPATLDNYQTSEATGVSAMMSLVTSYASQCPNSKMVLMGYSQGAQVTMDLLCGTNEVNFASTQALSADIMEKGRYFLAHNVGFSWTSHTDCIALHVVAAVVLMGDPSKAANETFLQGTSTKDGVSGPFLGPGHVPCICQAMTILDSRARAWILTNGPKGLPANGYLHL